MAPCADPAPLESGAAGPAELVATAPTDGFRLPNFQFSFIGALLLCACFAHPIRAGAQALPAAEAASAPSAAGAPAQAPKPQTIEVRGRLQRLPGPGSTLQGAALRDRAASTLGATLEDEAGVANASFGPSVGLPLIRGQGSSRVRTQVGGTGVHDASAIAADHGAMVEAALAERIVVHRGPAAIRFGGGAFGGAVEIDDGRVPERQPASGGESRVLLRAAGLDEGLGALREGGTGTMHLALGRLRQGLGLGGRAVLHADAHVRRHGDVRIAGPAIDEDAVRSQFQLVTQRNTDGFIENSRSRSHGGSVGLGWIAEAGFAGLAVSTLEQNYGVPPAGHSHGGSGPPPPGVAALPSEVVRIAARQHRADVKAEWTPAGSAGTLLRLRLANVDYRHDERDGARLSTTFLNRVIEGRLEIEHRGLAGWTGCAGCSGTLGLQGLARTFSALGDESFLPTTRQHSAGVFALQRWDDARHSIELGLRADEQRSRPDTPFAVLGVPRELPERRYRPRSASLALERRWGEQAALTLGHWRIARAPELQELYAGGPHLATRSFDFGNTGLGVEELHAWDLALRLRHGPWALRLNLFAYRSPNYIVQRSLGWFYEAEEGQPQALCARLENCLPATKREQLGARFDGAEAELAHQATWAGTALRIAVFAEGLRARLSDGQDVPRMPAPRAGLALEAERGAWSGTLRWARTQAQRRPGLNETPTAGHTQLHGSLRWRVAAGEGEAGTGRLELFAVGRNLGNARVRNSASFLRNFAPEPGRSVQLGLEWQP